jgi:hypothetical protein
MAKNGERIGQIRHYLQTDMFEAHASRYIRAAPGQGWQRNDDATQQSRTLLGIPAPVLCFISGKP